MYIDGFVLPVPTARRAAYLDQAARVWDWMRGHGALSVTECWGDDVPLGTLTSFPRAVQLRDDETVVLSWVAWPDKATRDAAYASGEDPAPGEAIFDGRRLIYGGFVPILERTA